MISKKFFRCFPALVLLSITLLCSYDSTAQSDLEQSIARGGQVYTNECVACHMGNGEGITGAFPPLANSDYFADDLALAVYAIVNGLEGEVVVNGNTYFGVMDPVELSDQEVADVLNFIRNSWGGMADEVTVMEVGEIRKSKD